MSEKKLGRKSDRRSESYCQNGELGNNGRDKMRRKWRQTGDAEIVRLASGRSLRLKLRLYNVEGAGRDARNEATTCASWGERN